MTFALERVLIIFERGYHKRPRPVTAMPICCVRGRNPADSHIDNGPAKKHDKSA